MGEVLRHRGGPGAVGRRPAAAGEHEFGAPAWISLLPEETEPKPPQGYVVSFVHLHERGFGVPVCRFMRALCDYYGAELHNFRTNSISQAAVFVAVARGTSG